MTPRYQVEVLATAARAFSRLPKPVRRRIAVALRGLEENPWPRNSKKLRGGTDAYRLRVGNCRVLYEIDKPGVVVTIVEIGSRGSVY